MNSSLLFSDDRRSRGSCPFAQPSCSFIRISLGVMACVALVGLGDSAGATPLLDQNIPNTYPHLMGGDDSGFGDARNEWQQIVTAGLTGQLTGLKLYSSGTAEVRIGLGSPFYSGPWAADIPSAPLNAPVDGKIIDLSPYKIFMSAGTTFVVDVIPSSPEIYPLGGDPRPWLYPGGGLWHQWINRSDKNPWSATLSPDQSSGALALQTFVDGVALKDIIQDVVAKPEGHGIRATFSTKPGYTLDQAAKLGEFDHFNWLSLVTDATYLDKCVAAGRPEDCKALMKQDGNLPITDPSQTFFDPVKGGFQYQVDEANKKSVFKHTFPVQDDLDYYLDEKFTPEGLFAGDPALTALGTHTTTNTLTFEDYPCTPFGEHIDYLTVLSGVKRGGGSVALGALGVTTDTVFRWRYTNLSPDLDLCHGYVSLLDNLDPSLVSSGFSTLLGFVGLDDLTPGERLALQRAGMEFPSSVSEPSVLVMLSTYAAMLLAMDARLRRRRLEQDRTHGTPV